MRAMLRQVRDGDNTYQALMFVCPGCEAMKDGGTGLHMLPVSGTTRRPMWSFDGNLDAPTLSPSILTRYPIPAHDGKAEQMRVCHSFLRAGVFEFLSDCTHDLAGKTVPLPDLPDWAAR